MPFRFDNGRYSIYNDEIVSLFELGKNFVSIATILKEKYFLTSRVNSIKRYVASFVKYYYSDKELLDVSIRLAKKKQRLQDVQRIERKSFRESARIENALIEYNKAILKELKKEGVKIKTIKHKRDKNAPALVLQLSDLHLNELIELDDNRFDFEVAAQRLRRLAKEVIEYGKFKQSKTLFIACLGDFLNSDRRIDEFLSMATNRAKATQLAVVLLANFIADLNTQFNIHLEGVTGNESRVKQEIGYSDVVATDNYDFTIYDQLRLLFQYSGAPGIYFGMMQANENVVEVNGKNFLLLHGHTIGKDVQKSIQEIIGRFANKGTTIHYVIFGHIHASYISDFFSRNASLCGSNAYSKESLRLLSRAAQNLLLVYKYDRIDGIKIDLQSPNIKGYDINSDIDAYNAKSAKKLKRETVIVKIVV